MRRRLQAGLLTAATVLLAGCGAAPAGELLGVLTYLSDRKPPTIPASWVYTADDLARLQAVVGSDPELSSRLASVDPATAVVVSIAFDGCSKADPELVPDGTALTVHYRTALDRECVRAVETLAVFSVGRDRLPTSWTLEVCGRTIEVAADTVTGAPIPLC